MSAVGWTRREARPRRGTVGAGLRGRRPGSIVRILTLACAGCAGIGLWGGALPVADAGPDLDKIRNALLGTDDPRQRRKLVADLREIGGLVAAGLLDDLVAKDENLEVRLAAAHALGRIQASNATELLALRLGDGGPLRLRRMLALALKRRPTGPVALRRAVRDDETALSARLVLVEALRHLTDPGTLQELERLTTAEDEHLRGAAIVAYALREDARDHRQMHLTRLLLATRTPERALQLMDAVEPLLHASMKPALSRLATFLEPAVKHAAEYLLGVLARKAEMRAGQEAGKKTVDPDDRYGRPESHDEVVPPTLRPPPPVARARFDIVYVVDATGSADANLRHLRTAIRQELDVMIRVGASVRIGLVIYRGGHTKWDRARSVESFPLSYDPARIFAWLDGVKTGGVDNMGAAVSAGLREGMDRMLFRSHAHRVVQLHADSVLDDGPDALRTARHHFRGDGTLTRVMYMLRTRTKIPTGYAELARQGGTAVVERVK